MDILNYINGKQNPSSSNNWLENINPATREVLGRVADSNAEDIGNAVQAANKAFPQWSSLSLDQRADYILKLSQKISDNFEELALLETKDTGKPISTSQAIDIPRSVLNLKFFADYIKELKEKRFDTEDMKNSIENPPLGVVGIISPWNLPLYLLTWKIAPALITGNTVVAKPSEFTPTTAFRLGQLCEEIGLPPGVLNIVHGTGDQAGTALVEHPDVKAISFTGSTRVGRIIANSISSKLKKVSLELGGKNPFIILENANIDKAAQAAARAAFTNQGQICICGSRIYAHQSIYEEVKAKIIEEAKKFVPGNPLNKETNFGSVVSKQQFDKIHQYLDLAKKENISFLTGSDPIDLPDENKDGLFISPTLLEGVGPDHPINQEEIFGPVATIQPFETEEEVVQLANNTEYGLAASVFSKDIHKAKQIASQIESGIVWVNSWLTRDLRTPFGGMKQSGLGREGGEYSLNFFTETRNICVSEDE